MPAGVTLGVRWYAALRRLPCSLVLLVSPWRRRKTLAIPALGGARRRGLAPLPGALASDPLPRHLSATTTWRDRATSRAARAARGTALLSHNMPPALPRSLARRAHLPPRRLSPPHIGLCAWRLSRSGPRVCWCSPPPHASAAPATTAERAASLSAPHRCGRRGALPTVSPQCPIFRHMARVSSADPGQATGLPLLAGCS